MFIFTTLYFKNRTNEKIISTHFNRIAGFTVN
jgi:hypothetical protein